MTINELAEIKARLAAITNGARWGDPTEPGHLFYSTDATSADEAFVLHAPADIAALVAEVERLRSELCFVDRIRSEIGW